MTDEPSRERLGQYQAKDSKFDIEDARARVKQLERARQMGDAGRTDGTGSDSATSSTAGPTSSAEDRTRLGARLATIAQRVSSQLGAVLRRGETDE